MAGHDDIDFIHSKHAGRAGRCPPGRYGGLEPLAILLPTSDVRKRRIAPAKLAIGAKLNDPSAVADRRFEPNRIFAFSDHLNAAIFNK
jgi:hypothetical protein